MRCNQAPDLVGMFLVKGFDGIEPLVEFVKFVRSGQSSNFFLAQPAEQSVFQSLARSMRCFTQRTACMSPTQDLFCYHSRESWEQITRALGTNELLRLNCRFDARASPKLHPHPVSERITKKPRGSVGKISGVYDEQHQQASTHPSLSSYKSRSSPEHSMNRCKSEFEHLLSVEFHNFMNWHLKWRLHILWSELKDLQVLYSRPTVSSICDQN